jgi:hypothetical protein
VNLSKGGEEREKNAQGFEPSPHKMENRIIDLTVSFWGCK